MLRDINMHQPMPAVGQHNEHEQDSKVAVGIVKKSNAIRSGRGSSGMFATPATAASDAGPCTSTPSPARQSGRASTARREILGAPQSDWRGSSAESDPAGPCPSRADPIGVDSSTPSSVGILAGASRPPSPAVPAAMNAANSSTASTAESRRFGPSLSAVGVAGAPSTRRVAAVARGSPAPTRGVCEQWIAVSQ